MAFSVVILSVYPISWQSITDFLKWKNRMAEYNRGSLPEGLAAAEDEANRSWRLKRRWSVKAPGSGLRMLVFVFLPAVSSIPSNSDFSYLP